MSLITALTRGSIASFVVRRSTISTQQDRTDTVILMQALTAALTYTLRSPLLADVFPLTVKLTADSLYPVTIVGTVDGVVNPVITVPGTAYTLLPDPDGTQWVIV